MNYISGARSARNAVSPLRFALILLLAVSLILPACSRSNPTAPRWKIHIEPNPAAPAGLDLKIAPPESGYAHTAIETGDQVTITVTKHGDIALLATITRLQPGDTYRIALQKARGHAASITAAPTVILSNDSTPLPENRLALEADSTSATLSVHQRQDP